MSISSYDELNIRPNNRRSEPYKEYFSKMSISDKEKQERIAFSEQMEEVVLYILSLIETTIESGETNREYIQTQFYDKYLDVIASYMLIDTYIKQYALGGYQLRNKTSGSQGEGKKQIDDYKPAKTYTEGLKQGYKKASKEIAHLFDLHLVAKTKKEMPTVNQQKAMEKFNEFLNFYKEN